MLVALLLFCAAVFGLIFFLFGMLALTSHDEARFHGYAKRAMFAGFLLCISVWAYITVGTAPHHHKLNVAL